MEVGIIKRHVTGGMKGMAFAMGEEEKKAEDIVLTVFMHCEGCARKVRRCLKGFQGVESVETDCASHRVVVKGEKADPVKVLGRLETKTRRRVELISPQIGSVLFKTEHNKPLQPHIITVVLKVHMHCQACAQEIKTRIHRMKGVQSVEADLKSSEVRVKGAMDPAALLQYVHRTTGKHAAIIAKQDPELIINQAPALEDNNCELEPARKDDGQDKLLEEKKDDAGSEQCKVADVVEETKVEQKAQEQEEEQTVKVKKNEYSNNCFPPQRYIMEMYPYPPPPPPPHTVVDAFPPPPVIAHAYPPQMFSDENPNACSLM